MHQAHGCSETQFETPPTPQPTPDIIRVPRMAPWLAVFNLQTQMHELLWRLDQLEKELHEFKEARTIWLPHVFLAQEVQKTDLQVNNTTKVSGGDLSKQSWDAEEWKSIVRNVIGDID